LQCIINLDYTGEHALSEEFQEMTILEIDHELGRALQMLNLTELDLLGIRFFEMRSVQAPGIIPGLAGKSCKNEVV